MKKNQELKNKIERLFLLYTQNFSEDYRATTICLERERALSKNKFSEIKGNKLVHRQIHQLPEILYGMFIKNLSMEEMVELKSKEMGRWVAKRFPEFSSTNYV